MTGRLLSLTLLSMVLNVGAAFLGSGGEKQNNQAILALKSFLRRHDPEASVDG